jgi:hypothetical protein
MNRFFILLVIGLQAFLPLQVLANSPNDPLISRQWYLEKVRAYEAWQITTGSPEIIIAVLDSGIDFLHPDLEDNIWFNSADIFDDGIDNDNNGYIDDTFGYDFVLDEPLPFPVIYSESIIDPLAVQHGTIVAGIIGAVGNNMEGITGISWRSKIMPLRVLSELGDGYSSDIASGIYYAVDNGANIINLSISGSSINNSLVEAIRYAYENNVIVVAAAGNEARNINDVPAFPACLRSLSEDWVIGVASSDKQDNLASFSNYGNNCVDISAPGVDMFGLAYYDPENGYNVMYDGGWQGTSFSAPVVSGAIALLLSERPWLTPAQIRDIIRNSADPLPNPGMGAGRLNIHAALQYAASRSEYSNPGIITSLPSPGSLEDLNIVENKPSLIEFIRTNSSPTVYILENGNRRVILNEQTYKTYLNLNHTFRYISEQEMSTYRLTDLVLPQQGRVLVKIQSDPKVYWLQNNPNDYFRPILRHINSESDAISLFGSNWSDYVMDIDPTMYRKFVIGDSLALNSSLDTTKLISRQQLSR